MAKRQKTDRREGHDPEKDKEEFVGCLEKTLWFIGRGRKSFRK